MESKKENLTTDEAYREELKKLNAEAREREKTKRKSKLTKDQKRRVNFKGKKV